MTSHERQTANVTWETLEKAKKTLIINLHVGTCYHRKGISISNYVSAVSFLFLVNSTPYIKDIGRLVSYRNILLENIRDDIAHDVKLQKLIINLVQLILKY